MLTFIKSLSNITLNLNCIKLGLPKFLFISYFEKVVNTEINKILMQLSLFQFGSHCKP